MRLFKDNSGKGTYKTQERAVKRAEEICEQFGVEFRYTISVSEEGRYFPIVIPRTCEQYLVGALCHNAICVAF